ncbi:hypothetical protein INT45_001663 [Circinella minor]|uniref:C-factor n=1 Tax=Circinella minor TaxID=1195481 RepID=A0A8H7VHX7_9FUNG|nr:hypothetical protein INT45_001663 [Circinella minor]
MGLVYVVTGATGGLGVEFIKQLSKRGDTVIACARNTEKSEELKALIDGKTVHAVTLDTVNVDSVKQAAKQIQQIAPEGIDVLINNSGAYGARGHDIMHNPASNYIQAFETNVGGTSNVTQALVPLLRERSTRVIVNISSIMGSIDLNSVRGGSPELKKAFADSTAYRVSKTAENMLTREFAAYLDEEDFVVIAMHPGWVQTSMGGDQAPTTPEQSISGMLSVIDKRSKDMNGTFVTFEGESIPW